MTAGVAITGGAALVRKPILIGLDSAGNTEVQPIGRVGYPKPLAGSPGVRLHSTTWPGEYGVKPVPVMVTASPLLRPAARLAASDGWVVTGAPKLMGVDGRTGDRHGTPRQLQAAWCGGPAGPAARATLGAR